jgi:membrane-bound lytic murein transglycosylase D
LQIRHLIYLSIATAALTLTGCNSTPIDQTPTPDQFNTEADFANSYAEQRVTVKQINRCSPGDQDIAAEQFHDVHYDDVWQRIRDDFGLSTELQRPQVQAQLNWYQKHPQYMNRVSQRATPYLYFIAEEIKRRNIPIELALVPIVESAYDPFAYSHGRAAGMWQFIPSTGKSFGLHQTWWYDGRRDVVASTNAALTYFTTLAQRYDGDWQLALAAYNSGLGTVDRAIRKNKKLGKPTDYWSLDLPRETKAYIPKVLALAELIAKPAKYNMPMLPIDNVPYFTIVNVSSQIDLAQAADMANIATDDLYRLNPGHNQWATDPNGNHELVIPIGSKASFTTALDQLDPSQRVTWQRYKIKPGDNLGSIAKRHGTTVAVIQNTNNIKGSTIRTGQMLMIAKSSKPVEHYSLSADQRSANKIKAKSRGNQLKNEYIVRSGDSFWKIAKQNNVSTRQLASWNSMAPGDTLSVGKKLVIWQPSSTAVAKNSRSATTRKLGYKVRSGDSLARIAGHFKVAVRDIVKWNTLDSSDYLQPGQHLTLYVDVTSGRR